MDEYITKKDLEEFRNDIKRYMGILSEDFQYKLGFVIDVQDEIKKDVKFLKQDVSALKQDVSALKQDVTVLKQDVKEIREELIAHRDNTEIHDTQIKRKRKLK
ncbi:hypothetical protein JZK55_13700 [Dissulfurispira thermophila]|uniref:Uncharacterized protein n=1 Tax=Dissulfurispira thermophila TaxID=2715679 RepID=A0A7G1H1F3_9BACT|nr:hypothetical protein [Dissulfurispira thermophila]BCB96448.1 hypothetical protein JZK55_13700 [Dissulfurispira thermophila]